MISLMKKDMAQFTIAGILLIALTLLHLQTLWASLCSMALSLYVLLTRTTASVFVKGDIIQFWIASIVWLAAIAAVFYGGYKARRKQNKTAYTGITDVFHTKASQKMIGRWIFGVVLFVAATAPVLSPFNPNVQGDLRNCRLLKPFEKVILAHVTVHEFPASDSLTGLMSVLHDANSALSKKDYGFTRWENYKSSAQVKTAYLGTDNLGRDILSRVLFGFRSSLFIGVVAVLWTILLGSLFGYAAGISGGWVDHILMRITDLFLAVPSLFLIVILVAFFGNSIALLIAVLAGTGWMSTARLIRGEVISLREREFVLAARLLGRNSYQIIIDHMIPNTLPIIIVASVFQLSNVILAETALSFLGLGVQPPTPSLGTMIGDSLPLIDTAWWVGLFPGLTLTVFVITVHQFGERLKISLSSQ